MVLFLVRVYRVANRPSWKDLLFVPRSSPASAPSGLQCGKSFLDQSDPLDAVLLQAGWLVTATTSPFLEAVEGTCVSVV